MVEQAQDSRQFSSIRTEIERIIENKVNEVFVQYVYNGTTAQERSNKVAEEIVKDA